MMQATLKPTCQITYHFLRSRLNKPIDRKKERRLEFFLRQENNTLSNIKMMLSMITPALTFEPHELAQFQSLQDNDVHRSNYEHGVFAHIQSWPSCSTDSTTRHDLSCSQVGAFVPTFVANHQQCIHVCEVFGGDAHKSTLRARLYYLKSGPILSFNLVLIFLLKRVDMTCGISLR